MPAKTIDIGFDGWIFPRSGGIRVGFGQRGGRGGSGVAGGSSVAVSMPQLIAFQ